MSDYVNGKAGAREDLCRFLAVCYYEPSTDFTDAHLFDSILAAASAIHPDLAECARKLGKEFFAQDMETLLVDHTALFVGPSQPKAMPYGSFWQTEDQSTRHEAMMAVTDIYEHGGFELSEDVRDLPDHIAVELEFLYALIFAQNQAQLSGNETDLSAANALHRRFLDEHVGAWFNAFSAAVNSGAETAFYRELVDLTGRFVRMEAGLPRLH
jgi:TorA maturation chaperone TorD